MAMKLAQFSVTKIEVICPHCGMAQPNPASGGTQDRTVKDLKEESSKDCERMSKRSCADCDKIYILHMPSKVVVSSEGL